MDACLKVSFLFFLWLNVTKGQFESGSSVVTEEKSSKFPIEPYKETRMFLKLEIDTFFSSLWKSLSQKITTNNSERLSQLENLNERILKIERNQEELSTNLSRALNESMGNLPLKLSDSFHERLGGSELKAMMSHRNLSDMFGQKLVTVEQKMENSLANLSGMLSEELRRREMKVETSLRNLSGTVRERLLKSHSNGTNLENGRQLPSTTPLTTFPKVESPTEVDPAKQPPILTEVEEINLENGTIEFVGGANSHLRRKIWVFRSEGGNSCPNVSFVMEENGLLANARLSLWDTNALNRHAWNGSQNDWGEERKAWGYVILITLTISPSAEETSISFKLKFTTTATEDYDEVSSEIVQTEGRTVVSFPPNNAEKYSHRSHFVAVIAPPHAFQLTLKYLDVPGTPPGNCVGLFFVFVLDETLTANNYKFLPLPGGSFCGRLGGISEPLGSHSVAILLFENHRERVGWGFRVDVN